MSLLQNKKIIMIYLIAFCVMGCFVCTYNFISYVLMAEPYNLSQTIIGFIFVLYLVGSVSSAVMGTLSDHYGHGIIIVISVIIQLVGILLTLFMPLIVKIIGLAIFTYGFLVCIQTLVRGHRRVVKMIKRKFLRCICYFTILALVHLVQLAVLF